ncbi:hypothetical protein FKP32DRAFT_329356 [Trametes sanguinea]|nr:hypothetical protein FKP32DRAFT_329356 [Trametes sanguinea]
MTQGCTILHRAVRRMVSLNTLSLHSQIYVGTRITISLRYVDPYTPTVKCRAVRSLVKRSCGFRDAAHMSLPNARGCCGLTGLKCICRRSRSAVSASVAFSRLLPLWIAFTVFLD